MREPTLSMTLASRSLVLLLSLLLSCSVHDSEKPEGQVSSRSYRGHDGDPDANNLVGVYPSIVGTRLDDCQTCHSGKIEDGKPAGSPCDHCHHLLLHGTGRTALETLNGFGRDYLDEGRSSGAIESIKTRDSDGDGFSNDEELSAGRYPGSEHSMPGQSVATLLTVTLEELKAVPSHSQFMLMNTTQQPFDDYVTYRGVTVEDLLDAHNIDLAGATGITLIAPDGYRKSLPIEWVDRVFPQPSFYSGLDIETLGAECGFVRYPEHLPEGVSEGSPIPGEHRLLLGYEKNGVPLDPADLDVREDRFVGEGPFRIVVPQENPGMPDRGSEFSPSGCGDGLGFKADADHSAGSMVRGVIAIRIDPMPVGVEEFDYLNGGWAYVNAGQIIIYGHGVG
ncbi:GEGP motif-containing diheme protein [Gemmatimonadota bacterium]